ncbi:hypothetical protein D920_01088 [Enterococcus faecalis 13-SD-W-01]|nr:hypothetical protein D920_01088 [Enterococcus faecalis 13-SD-W-01]
MKEREQTTRIMAENLVNFIIVAGFIFIHLSSNFFLSRKLNVQVMSSLAAGVGISYAIVHLLPHLAYFQTILVKEFAWETGVFYTHTIYAIVLVGLVGSYVAYKIDERTFMVLEKKDIASAKNAFFWSDISFHMVYNLMIGYIVIANTLSERFYIATYFLAFGLHFLMNDWTLYHHHGELYNKIGRFLLSLSIFTGAVLSMAFTLPYYVVISIEALITGALLMNIIKFELPDGGEGSIKYFLLGTIFSGILFVFI